MDSGFINRIRQILPLKVENRDPFLSALKESDSKKILKLLDNKEFCPTIDVLLSLDCSYYEALKKYFPDFPHAFRKNNYRIETGKDKDFTYYFLVAGKDLGVKNGHDRETGLWVRNRNFLVKPADFMSHQGMPPLISRQPLKNWIFGEVFHQKMHEFLEPSRKEYVTSDQNYREFRERLRKKLEPVVKVMEKAYDAYQAIIKEVKTPYDTLIKDDEQNPFRKLEKNLVRIEGIEIEDVVEEKADELFGKLSKIHNPHLEKCPEVISLIGKKKVTISGRMGKEENYKIIIDSGVEDESIRYDHVRQLAKALIPAMTFQQRRITLFHRGFTIIFVYCENIADAISINMEQMAIYVNIANKELKNHSISFLDVLIAAEYAYHSADPTRCQDVTTLECLDEMKETILHFLGEEYEQLSGFVDSLGSYFKGRESRDE